MLVAPYGTLNLVGTYHDRILASRSPACWKLLGRPVDLQLDTAHQALGCSI